jgi:hypothetical protein
MFGRSEPPRAVQVFWTTNGSMEQAAEAFWSSVESFESGMVAAGSPLTRKEVTVRAGSEQRTNLSGRDELAQALDDLYDEARSEDLVQYVSVRPSWDRWGFEMRAVGSGPASWSAQLTSEGIRDGALVNAAGDLGERLLARLAGQDLVDWGGVTWDHGYPGRTPYESYFPVSPEEASREAARHPRGYYWSNLLTGGHLEGLGGAGAVVASCRNNGLETELIDGESGSQAMIVRAKEPLSEFSDESLHAVHRLLDPILVHKPYKWYADWPLRIIKEPGTAFRVIDPTVNALGSVFDDDPTPDEDDW